MKITPIVRKVPKKNMRWLYRFGLWWSNWLSVQIMFFGVWIQRISSNEVTVITSEEVEDALRKIFDTYRETNLHNTDNT